MNKYRSRETVYGFQFKIGMDEGLVCDFLECEYGVLTENGKVLEISLGPHVSVPEGHYIIKGNGGVNEMLHPYCFEKMYEKVLE